MARYQNKLREVEAFQWTGGHDQEEDPVWICKAIEEGKVSFVDQGTPKVKLVLHFPQSEPDALVDQGCWIIYTSSGEIDHFSPEAFERLYEKVL